MAIVTPGDSPRATNWFASSCRSEGASARLCLDALDVDDGYQRQQQQQQQALHSANSLPRSRPSSTRSLGVVGFSRARPGRVCRRLFALRAPDRVPHEECVCRCPFCATPCCRVFSLYLFLYARRSLDFPLCSSRCALRSSCDANLFISSTTAHKARAVRFYIHINIHKCKICIIYIFRCFLCAHVKQLGEFAV